MGPRASGRAPMALLLNRRVKGKEGTVNVNCFGDQGMCHRKPCANWMSKFTSLWEEWLYLGMRYVSGETATHSSETDQGLPRQGPHAGGLVCATTPPLGTLKSPTLSFRENLKVIAVAVKKNTSMEW